MYHKLSSVTYGTPEGDNSTVQPHTKYAGIEYERRFLLEQFPSCVAIVRVRRTTDPVSKERSQQGFITSMYLEQSEFCASLARRAKRSNAGFAITG